MGTPKIVTHTNPSEALAGALRRHGVTQIFSQCFPIGLQHVAKKFGVRQIGFRTENSGGAMADGYARISRRIGVIGAQGGPGATLLVAPLAEAMAASIPLLALVEESAMTDADKNAFQELDHLTLFAGVAKWVRRVTHANRIVDYVDMAITVATSGRPGPAVLLLPSDVLASGSDVSVETRSSRLGEYPLDRCVPEERHIDDAADILAAAARPLIVAGGGVHISGASEIIGRIAETFGIPVATTNMGKGAFDEEDSLALGVFGNTMGEGSYTASLRSFAAEADVVLLVGTRTNSNGTDDWSLYPSAAKYIHIDIDSAEIGRNYEAFRLKGDAKATLELLNTALMRKSPDWAARRKQVEASTAAARIRSHDHAARAGDGVVGAIRPERLLQVLNDCITAGDIICGDASFATNWVVAFLTAKGSNTRFLTPRGLAGLGWGFPMAVGAKLARPESTVFALVGDGGFAHCWSELETAKRMKANVVVIVLNNQVLGLQKLGEKCLYGAYSDAADLGPVDHAAIARACGCYGKRVSEPGELAAALRSAMNQNGPALLDVLVDPTARPPVTMFEIKPGKTVAI